MSKKSIRIWRLSKRRRFIVTSVLLALGFIVVTILEGRFRFTGIGFLTFFSMLLFSWSLSEGLGKNATLLVLVLPTLFTLGVGLFWFLLPASIFSVLPILLMYGIGIYTLCLTTNIFTVSAIRTIALVRAAKSVGFVLVLLTSFLLFDAVLSIRASVIITFLLVFIVSFPLFLHGLWVSRLTLKIESKTLLYSLIFSFSVGVLSIALYFWPVTVIVGSLFLTVAVYVLLGLGQSKLEGRLFYQTTRDYLIVGATVFMVMLFSTHWRG